MSHPYYTISAVSSISVSIVVVIDILVFILLVSVFRHSNMDILPPAIVNQPVTLIKFSTLNYKIRKTNAIRKQFLISLYEKLLTSNVF